MEGQTGALTARRRPSPITDCGRSAAGREGRTERAEVGGGGMENQQSGGERRGENERTNRCAEREREKTKESQLKG